MFFSIIVPVYNKENHISDTILSALNQTVGDFELIIVNDGSTDKSLELVQSFSDKRIVVINKPNGGVSLARNIGIKRATGEYISFLDADDFWNRRYLETMQ